jgi:hypothetical protein
MQIKGDTHTGKNINFSDRNLLEFFQKNGLFFEINIELFEI